MTDVALQPTPEIPDKLFFRIGEASQLVGVEAHVLRYWESEFPGLSPRKSSSGQRMFRRKDVELVLEIKRLHRELAILSKEHGWGAHGIGLMPAFLNRPLSMPTANGAP